jgi:ParB family chromosome partitioning protein
VNTVPDKQRKALGKGLSALLPQDRSAALRLTRTWLETGPQVASIPIANIHPNPLQPRTVFDATHLEELANSIETHGIIQPLLVRRKGPAMN